MATSGGQPGNQNAAKTKRWQQAIQRALARASNKDVDTGLDSAADKLVALALEGDKWAIDHMADRMDGKPSQSIEASVDAGGGLLAVLAGLGKNASP